MSVEIRFLEVAEHEMEDSFAFYEQQMVGLGHDFLSEILITLRRIKNNPEAWAPFSSHTRRCLVSRFPYGIVYQIWPKEIIVVAVAHLHRKPGYWKSRLKK